MINSIINNLSNQKWSALSLEIAILTSNVFLFTNGYISVFLGISVIIILSLFCLQIISRRFLLFFPSHPSLGRPTPMFDTHLLRSLIIISLFSLVIGVIDLNWKVLSEYKCSRELLIYFSVFFILILPAFWSIIGNKLIQDGIIDKFRNQEFVFQEKCPSGNHSRNIKKELVSEYELKITYECGICAYKYSVSMNIIIGY